MANSNLHANGHEWPNLSLRAGDSDRLVVLAIDEERTEIRLSGSDQTWVLGQGARVQLFMQDIGGVPVNEGPSTKERLKAGAIALLQVLAGAAIAVVGVVLGRKVGHVFGELAALIGIIGCMSLFGFLRLRYEQRANRPLLLISAEVERGSWWERLSTSDRLVFAGVLVAAVGVLVAAVIGVGQIQAAK